MPNCIPAVASFMLGIRELELWNAVALIQDDQNSREFLVVVLKEIFGGALLFDLMCAVPEVTHHLHNLDQLAEDIISEVQRSRMLH